MIKLILDLSNGENLIPGLTSSIEQWKILFMENLYQEIHRLDFIPKYFLQSFYDGQAIKDILGFTCAEELASLSECSTSHQ